MFNPPPSRPPDADVADAERPAGEHRAARRGAATLRLEARLETDNQGWVVRIPVRAEEVTIRKEVVVAEEVTVRHQQLQEVVHLDETVRREELRVETAGQLEVVPDEPAPQATPSRRTRSRTRRTPASDS